MTAVSQITTAVFQAQFVDGMSAGANAASGAMQKLAGTIEVTDTAVTKAGKSAGQLAAAYDPATQAANRLAAAQKALSQAQDTMALAVASGSKSQDQAAGVLDTLSARVATAKAAVDNLGKSQNSNTASSGQQAFALRQLAVQGTQFFSSIEAGQPILTAFIQQGHQIADVALSTGTGLGVLSSAWKAITSPIGLAITSFVAVAGAIALVAEHSISLASQTRDLTVALAGVGRSADLSTSSLQSYIATLTHAGISGTDAQSIITQAARNPAIGAPQLSQIAANVPNIAAGTGQSAVDIAKAYTDALSGNVNAIIKLDDQYNFLSVAQRNNLRDTHDTTDAINTLNDRMSGLAQAQLSNFGKLWQALKTGADTALTAISHGLDNVAAAGKAATQGAAFDVPGVETASPADLSGGIGTVSKAETDAVAAGNPLLDQAAKKVQDLTKAYTDQLTVLRAAPPARDAVRAGLEAESKTLGENISASDAAAVKTAAMAAANAQAADAANQQVLAMNRQVAGALLVADATDKSRAAGILATATVEAYDKAATQAGINIQSYAAQLVNVAAAQALTASKSSTQDLQDQVDGINRIAAAQQLSARAGYWTTLSVQEDEATKTLEAYRDAATDPRIADALTLQISKVRQLTQEEAARKNAQVNTDASNQADAQISILQKTIDLQGQSNSTIAQQVASYTELLKLEHDQGADPANLTAEQQRLIDVTGSVAGLTQSFQDQKSALSDIAGAFTSAFDTISTAITNSFLGGTGAAVNWGNVVKSVLQQVISEVLKLAVLQPILNSLFNQNGLTLTGAVNALSGTAGTSSSGGGSILSLLGLGTQASGLTGTGGISALLSGGIFGTSTTEASAANIANAAVAGGPDVAATGLLGGASFGSAIGGVGLGFGKGAAE